MPIEGEYGPSTYPRARDQVAVYESSGGTEGTGSGEFAAVILTTRGAKTGLVRKSPLIRVERDGHYLVVASMGGAPKSPNWAHNLRADPAAELQDGPSRFDVVARELTGPEREDWWKYAVAAFPPYGEDQEKTSRVIPIFLLEKKS
jgi:F420H(2)-dependent quinone reductase